MSDKIKKVGEIFSDYKTNSNIKYAEVVALNVVKKTNTLEVIIKHDEYIEIKEIWFFEKFLKENGEIWVNIFITKKYCNGWLICIIKIVRVKKSIPKRNGFFVIYRFKIDMSHLHWK